MAPCALRASIAAVVGIAFTAAALAHAPADARISAAGAAAISQQLAAAVDRGDTPGVVALVVDRDGVLYEGRAGQIDAGRTVPMPADAIFNIASMTKPVTSVAIMMLLEQGKLALDDPVAKFLDGFDNRPVIASFNSADASYETRPAKRPLTIRHLLTHTSGLGYAFSDPTVAALQRSSGKSEVELPLLHDAGEKWTYSASTRVLGSIVERITGMPLEEYFQTRIFAPLGMVDTSYGVASGKQSRVAVAYTRAAGGGLDELPRVAIPSAPRPPFRGDGGLYSTARDYGLFIRMLLNDGQLGGVRILSAQSVAMMGENQIGAVVVSEQPAADPTRTKPFPLGAGRDKFGLGFQIAAPGERDGHRSPGSLSWAGLFNTEFWIDPLRRIGGVQMMQLLPFYDPGAIRTLRDFEQLVYRHLD